MALFAVMMMFSPELQAFAATPTPEPTVAPTAIPDISNFQPLMILRIIFAIFMAVIATMGGIQIAKSVQELSTALQQNDSTATNTAIRGIVGGSLQAFISVLLAFFGITV